VVLPSRREAASHNSAVRKNSTRDRTAGKSNGTERWAAHPEGGSYAAGVVGPPLNWQWTRDVYDHCRKIETDISFYLVMVTAINIAIGFVVMATTAVLGIPDPLLWGTLAAVLSFAPYVGEFAIVILLSLPAL